MYKSPRKSREDRYERLLHMIHTFKHTKQEQKLLAKIKADTVFEITLRHKRSEANKKYQFPFNQSNIHSDDEIESLNPSPEEQYFVYDLNSQNNKETGKYNVSQRKKSHSQTVLTEPKEKEKARSLSKKIKRVLIERLEEDEIFSKKRFHDTYKIPTQSTFTSHKHSGRYSGTPKKTSGSKTCRTSAQKLKTEQSPIKNPRRLLELETATLNKLANRLRTEKSNEKKSKIETYVSNELKRQAKGDLMTKCASSSLKAKSKNILYKGYY